MDITGVSHLSIGVTDMERSVAFYAGVLGLTISLDREEEYSTNRLPIRTPGDGGGDTVRQHSVYLRWRDEPGASFVVLTQQLGRRPFGEPAAVHQTGTNHFGFWVRDLGAILDRARAAGIAVTNPSETWEAGYYGEPRGGTLQTVLLRDPDGAVVQLDAWVDRPGG
jgi:catechol 2,3-dioxygenase-like lactoylglutathione lyase family enzyme